MLYSLYLTFQDPGLTGNAGACAAKIALPQLQPHSHIPNHTHTSVYAAKICSARNFHAHLKYHHHQKLQVKT